MPKRTYQPSQKKRMTTHGFLVRAATKTGAKILKNRRRKGRSQLAVEKSK
ncbi:50S ribosomal protein L34 [Candidatus Pacebacteria bacterium]|nr:50S ribosomal protein L34 [Candidatus Paceibacterota bacterium]